MSHGLDLLCVKQSYGIFCLWVIYWPGHDVQPAFSNHSLVSCKMVVVSPSCRAWRLLQQSHKDAVWNSISACSLAKNQSNARYQCLLTFDQGLLKGWLSSQPVCGSQDDAQQSNDMQHVPTPIMSRVFAAVNISALILLFGHHLGQHAGILTSAWLSSIRMHTTSDERCAPSSSLTSTHSPPGCTNIAFEVFRSNRRTMRPKN